MQNMHVGEAVCWLGDVYVKQFHACDDNEIAIKTETELGKSSIHVNDNKHSKKSRKQYSHK